MKAYEKKRVREFQTHWQIARDWLKYDDATGMWCSVCREFYDLADLKKKEQKLWLTGTMNYKIDTIKSHESSTIPMKAAKVEAVKATGVRQTGAGKAVVQLQMKCSMIQNRFRNAHAVVKHDLSFRTYSMLCELDAAKGYEMSADYMSDKACRTFVHVVADVVFILNHYQGPEH